MVLHISKEGLQVRKVVLIGESKGDLKWKQALGAHTVSWEGAFEGLLWAKWHYPTFTTKKEDSRGTADEIILPLTVGTKVLPKATKMLLCQSNF